MSDVCALDFDLSPLDGHSILDSADADEAERVFARVYRLGRVRPKGGSREFVARMQHRRIGGFSINRLAIDTPADVDTGVLRDFYLIHTPVQGRAQVTSRGRSVALRAGESAIYSTRAASLLELEPGCDRLMIRLDREVVERVAGAVLGHPPSRPIEFAPHLQGGSTAYLRWWGLVQHVLAELARDAHAWDAPLVRSSLEQMLAATLLQYQPNDALPGSGFTPTAATPPRRVRRVMDWIAAHAHEPVTLDDVAAIAGCGLSALYAGFRDTLGTTPMAYLRDIRLERVRAELRAADPAACRVTEVATRWGFFHFGRFAGAYKRRFGELPRDTLRR